MPRPQTATEIANEIFSRTGSYAGAPWSETDDRDLRAALEHGSFPREIAKFLMRTEDEVSERIRFLASQKQ
jgi:hypothetical protein